jgi:hypothetical protein
MVETEPDAGPGGILLRARCPICRKNAWTPQADGAVAGLNVRPFVCDTCGFVALMHDPRAEN